MDISVTIYDIDLRFSVYILKVPLEGSVSQLFYLGPSFHFMAKKRVTFCLFNAKQYSTFHKIKNLRHSFLHLYLINKYSKFQSFTWNIK